MSLLFIVNLYPSSPGWKPSDLGMEEIRVNILQALWGEVNAGAGLMPEGSEVYTSNREVSYTRE
jgi:hypothetical protein